MDVLLNYFIGKDDVYSKPITNLAEHRGRVQQAAAKITQKRYARLLKRTFIGRYQALSGLRADSTFVM